MKATIGILCLLVLLAGGLAWRSARSQGETLTGTPPELMGTWVSEARIPDQRTMTLTTTTVRWTTGDGNETVQPIVSVRRVPDSESRRYSIEMRTDGDDIETITLTLRSSDQVIVGSRTSFGWRRAAS